MSQIKHIILFIFALTCLSAQVADTAAVSVPPQDDVAAPLTVAAPLSPDAMPTVAVLDFAVSYTHLTLPTKRIV